MAPVPATAAAAAAPAAVVSTHEIRRAQRADGPATVLAIGTANPETCVPQDEYADFYFRVTKSEHLPELKNKLRRICNKSGIEKRFMFVNDDVMEAHPEFADRHLTSLDARVEIVSKVVPELAAAASAKAIAEWGRPATDITHLIFSTYSGVKAPGGDRLLASLLGLRPTVLREYGNMSGTTVIFVLNELRRRFVADGAEGADWGALMAFGPGVTVETILLRVGSGLKGN
uniref:Chalcone/stilbene synthase N-terminal domain-containing protein n=1 Tax=Oryza barthii TaxID=65489 RepID=A0A0D3GRB6_9ORYZ